MSKLRCDWCYNEFEPIGTETVCMDCYKKLCEMFNIVENTDGELVEMSKLWLANLLWNLCEMNGKVNDLWEALEKHSHRNVEKVDLNI